MRLTSWVNCAAAAFLEKTAKFSEARVATSDSVSDAPRCALCDRAGTTLTRHHLVPRARHRQKRTRKMHDRDARHETVDICRPCHSNLHAHLTEKQLADSYHTLEALREHPDVERFSKWIANKPPDLRVPMRRKKS